MVAVPKCRLAPARSSAFAVDVEAESAGRLAEAIPLYQQALADIVRVLQPRGRLPVGEPPAETIRHLKKRRLG